ncbi:hypothetical protein CYMTET_46287, partial [Cymbomonas tetramitiformis]
MWGRGDEARMFLAVVTLLLDHLPRDAVVVVPSLPAVPLINASQLTVSAVVSPDRTKAVVYATNVDPQKEIVMHVRLKGLKQPALHKVFAFTGLPHTNQYIQEDVADNVLDFHVEQSADDPSLSDLQMAVRMKPFTIRAIVIEDGAGDSGAKLISLSDDVWDMLVVILFVGTSTVLCVAAFADKIREEPTTTAAGKGKPAGAVQRGCNLCFLQMPPPDWGGGVLCAASSAAVKAVGVMQYICMLHFIMYFLFGNTGSSSWDNFCTWGACQAPTLLMLYAFKQRMMDDLDHLLNYAGWIDLPSYTASSEGAQ